MRGKQLYSYIDRLALNTWPAQVTETCGSWILRASDGVTKRANSVWTADGSTAWDPYDGRMERIEAFYKSHGLPIRFHVSDASPVGLDDWLEEQGFIIVAPCLVMIANAANTAELTSSGRDDRFQAEIHCTHDEEWLSAYIELEGHRPELTAFYDRLFGRIGHASGYLRLMCGNQCVAVGTSVAQGGLACFTNVVVHPDWRGQGLGKRLLHELASMERPDGRPPSLFAGHRRQRAGGETVQRCGVRNAVQVPLPSLARGVTTACHRIPWNSHAV